MASRVDRKGFEFRKVLSSVSDGLGREDVRALKNLCYEDLTERKREEIDDGIGVFNILIEKKRIGSDFPEFLVELLEEIGRMDLADKVKDYATRLEGDDMQPKRASDTLEQAHLMRIAEDVGRDWKMLARRLGLSEATVQSIQQQSQGELQEASLQALLRWKKLVGDEKATPRALKSKLTEMNLMGIVHTHFQ